MHFFHIIQQSASHVYHSALPLSPESSTFRSRALGRTRITEFYGRTTAWGIVLRTITAGSKRFTSMITFGHKIAATCDDDTVAIYDSVTGVLQLSLDHTDPIQAISGSPSGSILFCAHKTPSITVWDIQTGGLIHTFILGRGAEDIGVSLMGRYLACGLSDGSVEVWEVAEKMGDAAIWASAPVTCFCWLEPEELLVVSTRALARVCDVVAGTVLHSFTILHPIHHMVYSRKLNQLAIMASSESGSQNTVAIIDPQTVKTTTLHHAQQGLTCLAFSQTAEEVVCGAKRGGLVLFNVRTQARREIECPDAIKSVFPLPNGTVAAHFAGSGVQLLSLSGGQAESQQPAIVSALPLYSLDQGKIIAVLKTSRDRIVLLNLAGLSKLLEIPAQKTRMVPTDRTRVFCASLDNRMAVCCFNQGKKYYMQLWGWRFLREGENQKWTVEIGGLPSIGGISPSGARIVTFYGVDDQICVCAWDAYNGKLEAQLWIDPIHPLDITFDSDTRFYSHHDTYRIPYDVTLPVTLPDRDVTPLDWGVPLPPWSKPTTTRYLIVRREPLSFINETQRRYEVDDACEWVISDSKKICWIPPGYIGSVQPSYYWVGSSLFMVGQDRTLRMLTLEKHSEG